MNATVPWLLVLVALAQPIPSWSHREGGESAVAATYSPQRPEITAADRISRPKLTLQVALAKADNYILANRIDVSRYYLFEVRFILYGEGASKRPGWHIWWVHEDGALGSYIELFVDMDGVVTRLGSM